MTIEYRLVFQEEAWQLWPLPPDAYEYAAKKLRDGWADGVQAGKQQREVFIFRNANAKLSAVLANLEAAGIAVEQIEVKEPVPKDGNRVMARPVDPRDKHVPKS